MYTLGIETSCDETSCAVLKRNTVLANCTLSSVALHGAFGGVVPEIAARRQYEYIDRVYTAAVRQSGVPVSKIALIGVVNGPGLIGSLLVGVSFAKALAIRLDKPMVTVNHLYAHLYAPFLSRRKPRFPFLGYVISGGHTHLYLVKDFDTIHLIGKTRDDAVGEVYDKVARSLGLGYPGGPAIDRLFDRERVSTYTFRCGKFLDGFDTSFSGIKTAVVYKKEEVERRLRRRLSRDEIIALVSSFQESVVTTLVETAMKASRHYAIRDIVCGGGVVANRRFREGLTKEAARNRVRLYLADPELCTDNAATVAGLASALFQKGHRSTVQDPVYSTVRGAYSQRSVSCRPENGIRK